MGYLHQDPSYEKMAAKARVGKKVVLGRTKSTCKGPEGRKGLAYWRNQKQLAVA